MIRSEQRGSRTLPTRHGLGPSAIAGRPIDLLGGSMKRLLLSVCITMACVSAANAGIADRTANAKAPAVQSWSAWGGSMGVRWNYDLMANLGVRVESRTGQLKQTDFRGHEWFDLREAGGLSFSVRDAALQKFDGGSLSIAGGYVLTLADGSRIDLRNATLRVNPTNPLVLDLVSTDGKVWFFTDRIMFELTNANRTLTVHTADLRITKALAGRLHAPEAEGWGLGDFAMNTDVTIEGSGAQPD